MPHETLEDRFRRLCGEQHDISEHLGLLRGLAMDPLVHTIVEIGFRTGVSATALATAGKMLTCIDIDPCTTAVRKLNVLAPNFNFLQRDSLNVQIPSCDLLHIDSLHTYKQLFSELQKHAPRCRKWIAMHDTETFAHKGKDGSKPGLKDAIDHFLDSETGKPWRHLLSLCNNNGMTILERVG